MILVGLTGGIGSGKSTVINHFKELGVNCYQADKEAKKLMDSDQDLIKKIQSSFGDNIYINSKLDRKKLASIVFKNKEKSKNIWNIFKYLKNIFSKIFQRFSIN